MKVSGQLNLGKEPPPLIHWTGGWVGPWARLDGFGENLLPRLGYEHRTVQPAASHYTDSNDNKAKCYENPKGEIFMLYWETSTKLAEILRHNMRASVWETPSQITQPS